MSTKDIIHTLALAQHAENISAQHPQLSGFFSDFLSTLSPAQRQIVRRYKKTYADIAKSAVKYFNDKAKA